MSRKLQPERPLSACLLNIRREDGKSLPARPYSALSSIATHSSGCNRPWSILLIVQHPSRSGMAIRRRTVYVGSTVAVDSSGRPAECFDQVRVARLEPDARSGAMDPDGRGTFVDSRSGWSRSAIGPVGAPGCFGPTGVAVVGTGQEVSQSAFNAHWGHMTLGEVPSDQRQAGLILRFRQREMVRLVLYALSHLVTLDQATILTLSSIGSKVFGFGSGSVGVPNGNSAVDYTTISTSNPCRWNLPHDPVWGDVEERLDLCLCLR